MEWSLEVITALSSDHLPVVLTCYMTKTQQEEFMEVINWCRFKNALTIQDTQPNNEEEIAAAVEKLEDSIQQALTEASTCKQRREHKPLPRAIKDLIRQKNRARKTYTRILFPGHNRWLNQLTEEVKQKIHEYQNEEWSRKLEDLNTEHQSLCKMTRVLTRKSKTTLIPRIQRNGTQFISNSEKAEAFAEALAEQFAPNPSGDETEERRGCSHRNSKEYRKNNNTQDRQRTMKSKK